MFRIRAGLRLGIGLLGFYFYIEVQTESLGNVSYLYGAQESQKTVQYLFIKNISEIYF